MGLFERLTRWGDSLSTGGTIAPIRGHNGPKTSRNGPKSGQNQVEKWARPLAFTIDVAPEIQAAWQGTGGAVARVSRRDALSVPAVKRARDLICATIGTLPFEELTDPGNKIMFSELLKQPEEDIPRSVTMTMTAEDMLFEEVAWWRILKTDPVYGWPTKVRRLDPRSVTTLQNNKVFYAADGRPQGSALEWIPDEQLIRFDSPNAGWLTYNARTIRDAIALAVAASKNINNPIPFGILRPTDDMDPEDPVDGNEIADQYQDAVARRSVPYLNGQVELQTLQWTPEQLQFAQSRDAVVLEIARVTGLDPEELAVSTTSRTYQNSEQRRLDLLDFTINPYLTAIQDRLSMDDVTFPGRKVRADRHAFLKSDTKTRMETYEVGRRVGVYDDERIARIEEIPSAVPQVQPNPTATQPNPTTAQGVQNMRVVPAAGFAAPADEAVRFVFGDANGNPLPFKADRPTRTISGTILPWNVTARSAGYTWAFAPGSLHWSDPGRVKLDKDHMDGSEMGRAEAITSSATSLSAAFKVARGASGDDALGLAEDGVYDGLSVWVTFDGQGDGWIPHPDNEQVRYVQSATLRKVALTAMPAFDDARVTSVAATRKDDPVTVPVAPAPAPPPSVTTPAFDAAAFETAFTAGLNNALPAAMAAALQPLIQALPTPQNPELQQPGQRPVVPAGRRTLEVAEPMVYAMNGQGPSFVRDAWKARTEGDHEARERVTKFQRQTEELVKDLMSDPAFAINTGNAGSVIPPGYRPEMYITQLLRGRPLTNAVSRGTISDASPFNIPSFVSSATASADHVEGVNPSEGSLSVGTVTVSPGAISGLYKITREMADSANPAIDMIATQAMSESYSQQTEAKVYTELNGANGVGGTITSGFVPSGAQASAVTDSAASDQGRKYLAAIRQALALYPFRRFAAADFAFLSQEGTTVAAGAVDTVGRPLLPWVGPQNTIGTANTMTQGYFVDGLTFQPAWSMSGNTSGDADVLIGNRNDVWAWESPTLMFRFEERSGPAFVELALFGYFVCKVLRPVGLSGVRLTVS
jgi:phage head maturation protease